MKGRTPYRHILRLLVIWVLCLSVILPVFAQQEIPSDLRAQNELSNPGEQTPNTDTEYSGLNEREENTDTEVFGTNEGSDTAADPSDYETDPAYETDSSADDPDPLENPQAAENDSDPGVPAEEQSMDEASPADDSESVFDMDESDATLAGPDAGLQEESDDTSSVSSRTLLGSLTLKKKSFVYTGNKIRPSVIVKATVNGKAKELSAGTDYKISYTDNLNAGTATVTVRGKGNYRGTLSAHFKIRPVSLKSATLTRTAYIYDGSAKKPKAVVKAVVNKSAKKLTAGKDYSIKYYRNKTAGKARVIIKGKGNYTGTIKKSFRIRLEKTQLISASVSGKNVSLKWKKCTTPVSGYQIAYSTDRAFSSGTHFVMVRKRSATSYTVKKLTAQKTYYYRVRTYLNTGKNISYSSWSNVKTAIIPNTKNKKEPGMLTIIDDDGRLSFLRKWLPIIKEKGISISTAIAPYKMQTQPNRYMSWEQVQTCADAGAEVLCHTLMHRLNNETANMSVGAIRAEYKEAQRIMKQHGYAEGSRILIYSGSTGNLANARAAASSVFDCAISCSGNVTNHKGANLYYLRRYQINRDYNCDLKSMKKLIDDTKKNGGWMIWIFHSYEGSLDKDRLNNVSKAIDYALDQGLPIVSAVEGYERFLNYK